MKITPDPCTILYIKKIGTILYLNSFSFESNIGLENPLNGCFKYGVRIFVFLTVLILI